jgi:hypothetical protein
MQSRDVTWAREIENSGEERDERRRKERERKKGL